MLSVRSCSKVFRVGTFGGSELPAVRDVSFDVAPGEVLALIGESGSGKSTIARMVLRLSPLTSGSIAFEGEDIAGFRGRRLQEYYAEVQGVFQDPFSSYNPIFKADRAFTLVRGTYFPHTSDGEWRQKLGDALEAVSLDPGACLGKYPHQLSGGQLQRMLVARALLLDIRLLVADEIISMLDASTRVDVLNLLGDLRARGLGVLFITHDLSLGHYISDRAMILRHGSVVELGPTEHVFAEPRHPYTKALLASVPQLHTKWSDLDEPASSTPGPSSPSRLGDDVGRLVEVAPDHFAAVDGEG